MRRVARQPVEIGDRDGACRAIGADRLDRRIEHAHRDRHVARMRRDAGIAHADDGVLPAEAADRAAAAAGPPLVARLVGVVEIRAARPLQQVAGGGRLVAQLARSAGDQRAGQHAVVAPHARVGRKIGVAHQRADPQPAVGSRLDLVQREVVDVDQVRRRLDLQLHQIEQVGAASDELGTLGADRRGGGFGRRAGPFVGERFHDFTPATSAIASWMLE